MFVPGYNPFSVIDLAAVAIPRSRDVMNQPCTVCGSNDKVQMHHVRQLRSLNARMPKDYVRSIMSRMNRKQVPLCQACHIKVHQGKHEGPGL